MHYTPRLQLQDSSQDFRELFSVVSVEEGCGRVHEEFHGFDYRGGGLGMINVIIIVMAVIAFILAIILIGLLTVKMIKDDREY